MSKEELEKCQAAVELAKMRKGIKEAPSESKRARALENLEKGRLKWASLSPEQRKRKK